MRFIYLCNIKSIHFHIHLCTLLIILFFDFRFFYDLYVTKSKHHVQKLIGQTVEVIDHPIKKMELRTQLKNLCIRLTNLQKMLEKNLHEEKVTIVKDLQRTINKNKYEFHFKEIV